MPLDATNRTQVRNHISRTEGRLATTPETFTFSKAELQTAVNSIDAWIDTNATSLGNAIPAGIRAKFSTTQRIQILADVATRRIGRLRVEEDG